MSAESERPTTRIKQGELLVRKRDFWWRWIALAVPATLSAIVTRSGVEATDRTAVLTSVPLVIAMFSVTYPAWSRFFQIEPTRMSIEEFAVGGAAVGVLGLVLQGGLPAVLGLALALGGATVLACEAAVLLTRQRDGDTATTFFS